MRELSSSEVGQVSGGFGFGGTEEIVVVGARRSMDPDDVRNILNILASNDSFVDHFGEEATFFDAAGTPMTPEEARQAMIGMVKASIDALIGLAAQSNHPAANRLAAANDILNTFLAGGQAYTASEARSALANIISLGVDLALGQMARGQAMLGNVPGGLLTVFIGYAVSVVGNMPQGERGSFFEQGAGWILDQLSPQPPTPWRPI